MPEGIQISVSEPTQVDPDGLSASVWHAAPHAGPSNSGVNPSPSIESTSDDHARSLRRVFIGQMPAAVAAPAAQTAKRFWMRGKKASSSISHVSEEDERTRLRDRFLRRGGTGEDWEGEAGRRFVDRWGFLTGEWEERHARGRERRKGKAAVKKEWVGRTFEIGAEFWQVMDDTPLPSLRIEPTVSDKVLAQAEASDDQAEVSDDRPSPTAPELYARPSPHEIYATVVNQNGNGAKPGHAAVPDIIEPEPEPEPELPSTSSEPRYSQESTQTNPVSISSTRPLLDVPPPDVKGLDPIDEMPPSSSRLRTLRSALRPKGRLREGRLTKGKGKSVTFPPTTESVEQRDQRASLDAASAPPASPKEVLQRTGSAIGGTSAGSSVMANTTMVEEEEDEMKDVIMRDRMLLRALYTRSEDLPRHYDEEEARRHPEARGEDWAEHLVVWRGQAKQRIEIYEDHTFPGVSKWKGHKRLAFVIPLESIHTHLSLYSATDLTFCLTCQPTPADSMKSRAMFHLSKTGTNIFTFKTKSRSRAIDWMWKLWRHMGGKIPQHLDVQIPALDTRVRIFVPALNPLSLSRSEVLSSCLESILTVPDYQTLMERALKAGSKAELCWRRGLKLDWIWLSADVNGRLRAWEVLNGLAFRQVRNPTHLELRMAEHFPTKVVLTDGSSLTEPPAIEGYLHRYSVGPSRTNRRRTYVSSNDGNLMFMPVHRVRPPPPPVLPPDGQSDEQKKAAGGKFRVADTQRLGENILLAEEYIDLRDILIIRWAESATPAKSEDVSKESGNIPEIHEGWEGELHREEMEELAAANGDAGVPSVGTKQNLRVKRSFELVMRSGHVVRLEARTRKNASEWIHHLKALVSYWTRQQRVWARFEMDVTYGVEAHRDSPVRTAQPVGWYPRPQESADPDAGSALLPGYWHWCVLDGCRPVIKAGRLFQKTGYRKQFSHMYHVLVQGHLMQFKLTSSTTAAHRHSKTIPLADAYVYSGQSATATMPPSMDERQGRFITRYYQDGLEAHDSDEDTTFIIWYRDVNVESKPIAKPPQNTTASAHVQPGADPLPGQLPGLGGKNQALIFRARSKLERDAWCWALNVEIERLVRASVTREQALRDVGDIIP